MDRARLELEGAAGWMGWQPSHWVGLEQELELGNLRPTLLLKWARYAQSLPLLLSHYGPVWHPQSDQQWPECHLDQKQCGLKWGHIAATHGWAAETVGVKWAAVVWRRQSWHHDSPTAWLHSLLQLLAHDSHTATLQQVADGYCLVLAWDNTDC